MAWTAEQRKEARESNRRERLAQGLSLSLPDSVIDRAVAIVRPTLERRAAEHEGQGNGECLPCWMGAHRTCERGNCTCTDESHEQSDGPEREPRPIEERAATSAQRAG
jgi:hypothetical protein